MHKDDQTKLKHMLEAAQEAIGFIEGCDRESLDDDRKLALALVRCIEIVGEAATRVSDEFRDLHSEVPWKDIVGMRNRLIHAYFDIDLDRVWDTLIDDLPSLIGQINPLIDRS